MSRDLKLEKSTPGSRRTDWPAHQPEEWIADIAEDPERIWLSPWLAECASTRPSDEVGTRLTSRDMKGLVSAPAPSEIPLFAGLSEGGLVRVAAGATELTVEPGQVLTLPGDVGSGMFVLLDGIVSVELRGGEVEVTAPDFVGELALLLPEGGRVGRVRAKTNVRCLSLPRADFDALLESEPSFALALLRGLAARLAAAAT